jgi:hypothetical protein
VLTREKTPKTVLAEWIVVWLPFLHAIERLIDIYVVEFGSAAHNRPQEAVVCLFAQAALEWTSRRSLAHLRWCLRRRDRSFV